MTPNCTFDPADAARFPYAFFDANGTLITQGRPVFVPAHAHSPSSTAAAPASVCVFETETCAHNSSCCLETKALTTSSSSFVIPLVCFCVGYALFLLGIRHPKSREFWGVKGSMRIQDGDQSEGKLWLQAQPRHIQCLAIGVFVVVYMAAILTVVAEAVIMPKSIQETLEPADRSAQLAMQSFITPLEEIFQFIEDTMLVKVGYAIAAKQYAKINFLLHIGVIGGLLSAVCAFAITLIIFFSGPAANFFINPSHASNELLINGGCSLIPSTEQLLSHAGFYWILMTLRWIPKFSTLSIFGFLIGSGRLFPWMFSMIIQTIVPIAIWFSLRDSSVLPLHALGIAYSVPDWILGVGLVTYFVVNRGLQKQYNLKMLLCQGRQRDQEFNLNSAQPSIKREEKPSNVEHEEEQNETTWRNVLREVLEGGIQLMVVDLAVQLSLSITVYVAATQHVTTSYKLAASAAAYWNFGPSYLVGVNMMLKLFGSRLMGAGRFRVYAANFSCALILTLSLSLGAVIMGASKGVPIAYDFGSSACVFASQKECANVYASIFAGGDSLPSLFSGILGPTVAMQLIFLLLRAGLATMHDFSFMARSSGACFVIAFVPAIIVARAKNTAAAYFIAMYSPHFLMILVFGWRMLGHLRAIRAGQSGPWTIHSETLARGRSMSSGRPTEAHTPDVPLLA